MTVPDVTSHYSDTMKNTKQKVTARKLNTDGTINHNRVTKKSRRGSSYDRPTTIKTCILMYHRARTEVNDWMVALCQHIAIQQISREQLAELLFLDPTINITNREDAYVAAGRLIRLSKNEDALRDMKYGTQPIAKRITLIKAAM